MDALKENVEKLREVIVNGDVQGFSALMEDCGYGPKNFCDCPNCNRRLSALLSLMSAIVSTTGRSLDKEISDMLVDRIFPKIDFMRFAMPVIVARGIKDGNYSEVPRKILAALDEGDYSGSVAEQICGLSPSAVERAIAFVAYETDGIKSGYIAAIAKAVFRSIDIRHDLLLAFMSTSITPPERKEANIFPGAVMVVPGGDDVLSRIMEMMSGGKPESDSTDNKDNLDA